MIEKNLRVPRRRSRRSAAAMLGAVLVGTMTFVTACSGGGSAGGADEVPIDSNPLAALIKPTVSSSAVDGGVGFSPIDPVTVSVVNGKLDSVTLSNPDGVAVGGALAPDGTTWVNTEPLGYNREYTLETVAYGLGGATTSVARFTTSAPGNLTQPYVLPGGEGSVVGIGQPVAVQFDENIPDRRAAEAAITIVTNPPVEGAFYWLSNREVRWRPENYWRPARP